MVRRVLTIFGLGSALLAVAAGAQTPSAQPRVDAAQPDAGFRLTVVGRTTPAVNYRPRSGDTEIDFAGTALLPGARGKATVSGEKGYMKIDAEFDKLQPPGKFGREYLTYVLWAITPEGRAKNLGEVQYDDSDARVKVTTDLQAFGLIVTAEPYYAVTQPSDAVVLENVVREGTKGRVEAIEARYQLLQRGTYLMQRDASELKVKALEPGAPLDLAQARNAIELARLAEADTYAADTLGKARRLLEEAEQAREAKRGKNQIMMSARQAVQTAEEARVMALQKREEAYAATQRAAGAAREQEALDRERAALDKARLEEARRLEAEQKARQEAEQRQRAELDAQARETARLQAEQQARAEQERRQQAEADARVAAVANAAADRERIDAQAARAAAEQERRDADAARRAAEAQALQAQASAAQAERDKDALRRDIQEQLNVILETRETARGLIVNISDVLFDTGSANLKAGAREKLARVAGVIASHPGLSIAVEGHTDSVGATDFNQRLSEQRAQAVHDYLVSAGVSQRAVGTAGFGESQPVASNDSAAGRQQNRRVELVVTGAPIGR
jgi:outer membrane protein OmpA-like peptidoglycan-associated protein